MALADVVHEEQEPCAASYTRGIITIEIFHNDCPFNLFTTTNRGDLNVINF